MSNFNLISPEGNGYNFNVRFDEPIIVPENASIHMNWCQFERDNLIVFKKAQNITLVVDKCLPHYDWQDAIENSKTTMLVNGVDRSGKDLVYTIPAGKYSLAQLQDEIGKQFTNDDKNVCETPTNQRKAVNPQPFADNPSLILQNFNFIQPIDNNDPSFLELGMAVDNSVFNCLPHAIHKTANMEINDDITDQTGLCIKNGGTNWVASSTDGVPDATAYNGYALMKSKYSHAGGHFRQYQSTGAGGFSNAASYVKSGGYDELQNANLITFLSNCDYDKRVGSVFLGLYIEGYAGVDNYATPPVRDYICPLATDPIVDRMSGSNMKVLQDSNGIGGFYPKCHFGVELSPSSITGFTGKQNLLNIIHAEGLENNMEDAITGMKVIYSINLDKYRDPLDLSPVAFGIQTYYDKGAGNSQFSGSMDKSDLHIRVFLSSVSGNHTVIYDTNTKYPHADPTEQHQYFSSSFMETYNKTPYTADTITLAQAHSSIPFTPVFSATEDLEGGTLKYTRSNLPVADGELPNVMLLDYHFKFDNEIANLFVPVREGLESEVKSACYTSYEGALNFMDAELGGTKNLQMNENEFWFRDNNILGQYRQDKFSIVMNNLPIKSYKNTDDKSKSGYRKPILANVPSPFAGADVGIGNKGKILGSYASSLGIVNRLSNQAMTTNNFDILVLDLESDEPAEQLTKSIINFTINAE